jgi:hypothetical protein
MGVFGAITYLPLYLQGVIGISASRAGLVLLLLSLGWTAGSLLAGHCINRLGYGIVAAAGMALIACGYSFFLIPKMSLGILAIVISAIAIGTGMGLANLTTLVAAQTAVWTHRIGVATSTVMLFRTFGGAFAVSVMGTVLLHRMEKSLNRMATTTDVALSASLKEKLAHPQNLLEPATRELIPTELLPHLVDALGNAISYAFLTMFVLMVAGVVTSFLMGRYTPATTPRPDGSQATKRTSFKTD